MGVWGVGGRARLRPWGARADLVPVEPEHMGAAAGAAGVDEDGIVPAALGGVAVCMGWLCAWRGARVVGIRASGCGWDDRAAACRCCIAREPLRLRCVSCGWAQAGTSLVKHSARQGRWQAVAAQFARERSS